MLVQVHLKEIMSDAAVVNEKAWVRYCSAALFKDKILPMWGFKGDADSQIRMLNEMTALFVTGASNFIANNTAFKDTIEEMAFSVLSAEGLNSGMERELKLQCVGEDSVKKTAVLFSVTEYWKEKTGPKEFSRVLTKNLYQLYKIILEAKLPVGWVPGGLPSDIELLKVVDKLTTHEQVGVFDIHLNTKKQVLEALGDYLNSDVEACGRGEQTKLFMDRLTAEASKLIRNQGSQSSGLGRSYYTEAKKGSMPPKQAFPSRPKENRENRTEEQSEKSKEPEKRQQSGGEKRKEPETDDLSECREEIELSLRKSPTSQRKRGSVTKSTTPTPKSKLSKAALDKSFVSVAGEKQGLKLVVQDNSEWNDGDNEWNEYVTNLREQTDKTVNHTTAVQRNAMELTLLAHAAYREQEEQTKCSLYNGALESKMGEREYTTTYRGSVELGTETGGVELFQGTDNRLVTLSAEDFPSVDGNNDETLREFNKSVKTCEKKALILGGKVLVTETPEDAIQKAPNSFVKLATEMNMKKFDFVFLEGATLPLGDAAALKLYFQEQILEVLDDVAEVTVLLSSDEGNIDAEFVLSTGILKCDFQNHT
jgi:hypothetical protein